MASKFKLEDRWILFLYRYISLLITSIFYFIGVYDHRLGKKLFIIGCLLLASLVLSYLYSINQKNPKNIKTLLIIEIIGSSILLIPSGGIESPFIWYTLNIVLISSLLLKRKDNQILSLIHIILLGLIFYLKRESKLNILSLLKTNPNLILGLIMIIGMIQIWSIFAKRLEENRVYLEEARERFIIREEQDRIANEIHDSVLQRIFSMSCGIYSLIKRLEGLEKEEVIGELNSFREEADRAMKELRDKVYGLSWKKSGDNSFIKDMEAYIASIENFSQANISFHVEGQEDSLSRQEKKAFYRIICEAMANAVRHGRAKNIDIKLDLGPRTFLLEIRDNGLGFDLEKVLADKNRGLGIDNLYDLAGSLGGDLKINTSPARGTDLRLEVPNNRQAIKEELGI